MRVRVCAGRLPSFLEYGAAVVWYERDCRVGLPFLYSVRCSAPKHGSCEPSQSSAEPAACLLRHAGVMTERKERLPSRPSNLGPLNLDSLQRGAHSRPRQLTASGVKRDPEERTGRLHRRCTT
ncbi:hypothetical protein MRX96_002471 [Rhipicephalus microplus]